MNTRNLILSTLVLSSAVAAQVRQADFDRRIGNNHVATSVEMRTYTTRSSSGNGTLYSLCQGFNTVDFEIGGTEYKGIQTQSLAYSARNANGSLSTANWNGIYRNNSAVLSNYFSNGVFTASVGAATIGDYYRQYNVGPFRFSARTRVSAGAAINLNHQSNPSSTDPRAYLSGTTRAYLNGFVWNVVGFYGATASLSSTIDMDDATMTANLHARASYVGGNMSWSLQGVRLYMRATMRRYFWEPIATSTLVNYATGLVTGWAPLN